jgi:hypothetical protein
MIIITAVRRHPFIVKYGMHAMAAKIAWAPA